MSEVSKKKLKELSNRKEIISDFWRTEILPNWNTYRKILLLKGKENSPMMNNEELYNYKKKIQKFNFFLLRKNKNADQKEKEKETNVLYLWFLGIPDWLRNKLWSLVMSNDLEINENLFNFFLKKSEKIEFHEQTVIDRLSIEHSTPGFNKEPKIIGELDGIPILESTKLVETRFINIENPILNEIICDVHKSHKKFQRIIEKNSIEEKKFKEDLFVILRIFSMYRPDIPYTRSIAYIATVLYLNNDDFYQTFVSLSNFIIPSFLLKFLIKDEMYMKIRIDFFEKLIKMHLPALHTHFKNLDISLRLFFYKWIEFLYTK